MPDRAEKEVPADRHPKGALAGGPCPACSSPDLHVLFEAQDHYRIIECAKCRLIRLDPEPDAPPVLEPASHWPLGDSPLDRLERACRRFLLSDHVNFIARAIEAAGDQGPVLDFSPGGGLLRRALAERGVPVFGLDHSPDAAAVNWKAHRAPAVCATLADAPVAPSTCRAIIMLNVLEHFGRPLPPLEAAHALLRPGGRLILEAPNAACWQFLLLGEGWSGLDVPRHRIDFRTSDLEGLLRAAGFEVLRRKHFSLHSSPAGLARSLAPSLAPCTRRAKATAEGPATKLAKDLLWCALAVAAVPFTVLEAACRAGSTVMIEARKRE